MNNKHHHWLIKELISEILLKEQDDQTVAQRPAKQQTPQQQSKTFNQAFFSGLPNYKEMFDYADERLPEVGMGGSRGAFKLGDKVLKIAHNSAGVAQNKAEVTGCGSKLKTQFFSKIYQHDRNNNWIITDYAQKMTPEAWQSATGISWGDFGKAMDAPYIKNQNTPQSQEAQQKFGELQKNPFFRMLFKVIAKCQYKPGDIKKLDSWGLVNGKPVVIDSGFTRAVEKAFYTKVPGLGAVPKDVVTQVTTPNERPRNNQQANQTTTSQTSNYYTKPNQTSSAPFGTQQEEKNIDKFSDQDLTDPSFIGMAK